MSPKTIFCILLFAFTSIAEILAAPRLDLDLATTKQLLSWAKPGETEVAIGDMIFKVKDLRHRKQELEFKSRHKVPKASVQTAVRLWTNGIVPYTFGLVTPEEYSNFTEAIKEWERVAGLKFIPRTSESNYLFVQRSDRNSSQVGMVGGSQTINIYNWDYKYIMCHEIAHALGVSHEQCRSDRDNYVTIQLQNVQPGKEHNFAKLSTTNKTPYDFESIMHYAPYAFSSNDQPTILAGLAYASQQFKMGNTRYLSKYDIESMVSLYGPSKKPQGTIALTYVSNATLDQDGDTTVNPGDTIAMELELLNSSTIDALGVTASLSTSSSYVTIDDADIDFGTIAAGESKASSDFNFEVDTQAPPGHEIECYLNITDGAGNSFSQQFSLIVESLQGGLPILIYLRNTVNDGGINGEGDGNGEINPGESVGVEIEVQNSGDTDANNVYGDITTDSPYVTIKDSNVFIADVLSPGKSDSGYDFNFDVDPSTPHGTIIKFNLTLSCDEAPDEETTMAFQVIGKGITGKPNIRFSKYDLDDDNLGSSIGNGNNIPEAGEKVEVDVSLTNQGPVTATNGYMYITTSSQYAVVNDPDIFYNDILPGSTQFSSSSDLDISIDSGTPAGVVIPFEYTFTCEEGAFTGSFDIKIPKLAKAARPSTIYTYTIDRKSLSQVHVKWQDRTNNEDYYIIEVSRLSGGRWLSWKKVRTAYSPFNGSNMGRTMNLTKGTYRVRLGAVNAGGISYSRSVGSF